MLKLALPLCAVVCSLFLFQTPTLAIAIYNGSVQVSFVSEPIPFGTSISFSPGITATDNVQSGNALATSTALASTPGSATAVVSGFASGLEFAFSSSSGLADGTAVISNADPTSVTFPLTFSHMLNLSTSAGPNETVIASTSFFVSIDQFIPTSSSSACGSPVSCDFSNSGSETFLIGLSPGTHTLTFSVGAFGSASAESLAPVPEPASLLLLGTTMAGVGLARWRQRTRGQSDT